MLEYYLEWSAFLMSLCCVASYGYSKIIGGLVGIVTVILFILWGIVADVPVAVYTNLIFFCLHTKNLYHGISEKKGRIQC